MPLQRAVSEFEIDEALKQKTPLGFVVLYFYQDGTALYSTLHRVVEEISRRCPFSIFVAINGDFIPEAVLARFKINTFPSFVIAELGRVRCSFYAETKEHLIRKFKEAKVLKAEEEITNL